MLEYILRQVAEIGDDTIIISNKPDAYLKFGLPVYADLIPNWGALGGLYSAISYAPQELCLLLACDMPFIHLPLLKHIVSLANDFDAVVPRLNNRFVEPFRAVYRKTCLVPIKSAMDAGQRKVISFFDEVHIRYVDLAEIEQFDPSAKSFFNVNTPDDLQTAERIAEEMKSR